MSLDIKSAVQKPWVKYGLIAIGFVGVVWIIKNRESSNVAPSDTGGDAQAEAAVAQTQIQAAYGAASQNSAQNFQLAQQQQADKTALAGQSAGIAGQLQLATLNNEHDEVISGIQLQGLKAQLENAFQTQKLYTDLQMHISDNQTSVANTQTGAASSVVKNQSKNDLIGGIIGAAISFF